METNPIEILEDADLTELDAENAASILKLIGAGVIVGVAIYGVIRFRKRLQKAEELDTQTIIDV